MSTLTNAKILGYSEAELENGTYSLTCVGDHQPVVTAGSLNPLRTLYERHVQPDYFQFVRAQDGDVMIYSLTERDFCSAVDIGWAIHPFVNDEAWSKFKLEINDNGTICIRSTHPVAQTAPYVSIVSASRLLMVAEATPRWPWSYFIPRSAYAELEAKRVFLDEMQYKPDLK